MKENDLEINFNNFYWWSKHARERYSDTGSSQNTLWTQVNWYKFSTTSVHNQPFF